MQAFALGGAWSIGNGEHLHSVSPAMSISQAGTTLSHAIKPTDKPAQASVNCQAMP
jgi:hypothetical protein